MKKSGKNLVVVAIVLALVVVATAYAAFATELNLNESTATIQGDWLIEITNIEATTVVGTADAGTPSFTDTTATFDALLNAPGDSVTYTVTIENKGSIDAKLDSAVFTPDNEMGSPAIIYTYENPAASLAAGATTTFTVTATYDESVTEVPDVKTKTITGTINYVQES